MKYKKNEIIISKKDRKIQIIVEVTNDSYILYNREEVTDKDIDHRITKTFKYTSVFERQILSKIDKKYNWIVRDVDDRLILCNKAPYKLEDTPYSYDYEYGYSYSGIDFAEFGGMSELFKKIQYDSGPILIYRGEETEMEEEETEEEYEEYEEYERPVYENGEIYYIYG